MGKPSHPIIPNLRESKDDNLCFDGLTRGGLIIGKPGVGKTVWGAMQTLRYALTYPDHAIFSLDASGSFTDELIKLVHQLPLEQREKIERRIVYDRLGDPDWVTPFPFFSADYGLYYEEQVQRVQNSFKRLSEHLVANAPVLGGLAITETLPELTRLLCAIQDENGDCWQITEGKRLLLDENLLKGACKRFGRKVPESKWYFEREYLGEAVSPRERELRTFPLRALFGMIEPRAIRARVGYPRPGWTPKEAEEKGLIVLVSGEALINQESAQAILFTDVFSQILAQVNKRTPHNPDDKPVLLIIDEVPMLIRIPGMAAEIGKISPMYRSRKLQMIIIIQALWQLADNLKEQIWSMGNVACFGIDDFGEAYATAQQLFKYDPSSAKLPPASPTGHPIVEPDRGQYLTAANWLQHLKKRGLVLKRYITEGEEEPFVWYIMQTSNKPDNALTEPLMEIKERLLRRRAIPVKNALELINQRKLVYKKEQKRPTL